jgi:hypothetical protein
LCISFAENADISKKRALFLIRYLVEKRFIGGGDIDENTEEKIKTKKNRQNEVPVKPKKREKS